MIVVAVLTATAVSAAATVERVRVGVSGRNATAGLSPSLYVDVPVVAGYRESKFDGEQGDWRGLRLPRDAGARHREDRPQLRSIFDNRAGSAAAMAEQGLVHKTWQKDQTGTVRVPRVLGGRAVGSVGGALVLYEEPIEGSARWEAVLSLPLCHGVFGAVDFYADAPPEDTSGTAGQYLVGSTPAKAWNHDHVLASARGVKLDGPLPGPGVAAHVSGSAVVGRVADCGGGLEHVPLVLQRSSGGGWATARRGTSARRARLRRRGQLPRRRLARAVLSDERNGHGRVDGAPACDRGRGARARGRARVERTGRLRRVADPVLQRHRGRAVGLDRLRGAQRPPLRLHVCLDRQGVAHGHLQAGGRVGAGAARRSCQGGTRTESSGAPPTRRGRPGRLPRRRPQQGRGRAPRFPRAGRGAAARPAAAPERGGDRIEPRRPGDLARAARRSRETAEPGAGSDGDRPASADRERPRGRALPRGPLRCRRAALPDRCGPRPVPLRGAGEPGRGAALPGQGDGSREGVDREPPPQRVDRERRARELERRQPAAGAGPGARPVEGGLRTPPDAQDPADRGRRGGERDAAGERLPERRSHLQRKLPRRGPGGFATERLAARQDGLAHLLDVDQCPLCRLAGRPARPRCRVQARHPGRGAARGRREVVLARAVRERARRVQPQADDRGREAVLSDRLRSNGRRRAREVAARREQGERGRAHVGERPLPLCDRARREHTKPARGPGADGARARTDVRRLRCVPRLAGRAVGGGGSRRLAARLRSSPPAMRRPRPTRASSTRRLSARRRSRLSASGSRSSSSASRSAART